MEIPVVLSLGAAVNVLLVILHILFIVLSIFLVFVILIQPPRTEGLASAFSGVGGESFFGSRALETLTKFTAVLGAVLLVMAIAITLITRKAHGSGGGGNLQGPPAPTEPAPPAPTENP